MVLGRFRLLHHIWKAEGRLHVLAVIGLFRPVGGWSMNGALEAKLVTDALAKAWQRSKHDVLLQPPDRGIQGGFNLT